MAIALSNFFSIKLIFAQMMTEKMIIYRKNGKHTAKMTIRF